MLRVGLAEVERDDNKGGFAWSEEPAVRNLLDVIATILAEEFCRVARLNPETIEQKELEE
jgi:hypothetical protein